MTEHRLNISNLIKDMGSEIILSDEQIDENGNVVEEPVLVFATDVERLGYIPIKELQSWIIHNIYAPTIKIRETSTFPTKCETEKDRI